MKLTRKQIAEGLQSVPMAEIILGTGNPTNQKLTAKQIKFAEEIAKGETKAGAYRKAYKTKGKPETQSKRGQELTKNGAVSAQIEAFKVAIKAQEYLLPAHLRALTIHQLTMKALDPDLAPAQQIRCLELIGKMTEVSLFTERREIIHTNDSTSLRDQLLSSLRLAIRSSSAIDATAKTRADRLLSELDSTALDDDQQPDQLYQEHPDQQTASIEDGEGASNSALVTPPPPYTPFSTIADSAPLHSNPLKESHTLTGVSVTNPLESNTYVSIGVNPHSFKDDREGVKSSGQAPVEADIETPPL
jgi:hypothetical protein